MSSSTTRISLQSFVTTHIVPDRHHFLLVDIPSGFGMSFCLMVLGVKRKKPALLKPHPKPAAAQTFLSFTQITKTVTWPSENPLLVCGPINKWNVVMPRIWGWLNIILMVTPPPPMAIWSVLGAHGPQHSLPRSIVLIRGDVGNCESDSYTSTSRPDSHGDNITPQRIIP